MVSSYETDLNTGGVREFENVEWREFFLKVFSGNLDTEEFVGISRIRMSQVWKIFGVNFEFFESYVVNCKNIKNILYCIQLIARIFIFVIFYI